MLRFKFLLPPLLPLLVLLELPGSNLEMYIMEFYVSAGM